MTVRGEVDGSPIAIRGLSKSYGRIVAVGEVDLTVNVGDINGFLGPNGARKTTVRILLGLLRPAAGEVRLFGRDPQRELPEALDGVAGFVGPHAARTQSVTAPIAKYFDSTRTTVAS